MYVLLLLIDINLLVGWRMSTHIVSLIFVLLGVVLLLFSLIPTRIICKDQSSNTQAAGWHALFVLILLFIAGYILFAVSLLNAKESLVAFVVSLILFGGSIFVFLVTKMSLLSIQDVNRIAALERHHALHDDLTNLPNRTLLYERVNHAINIAKRSVTSMVVLIMDLNQFKEVNDTLGHHCGDCLLQQVAPRLKNVIRESDTVARIGGDEFSVVLQNTDRDGAIVICNKILSALEKPFFVEGHTLKAAMSIGIAKYPEDGEDCESLMQRADVAMYVAKKDASGYAIYDAARDQYSVNRLKIINALHDAINDKKIEVHYQPIVRTNNKKLWGFEALSRWSHPELGEIIPSEFISIAEQSSLIKELTLHMLDVSFRQFQIWNEIDKEFCLSVNLSVKDIQDADFPSKIKMLLNKYSINPKKINLEITESTMMSDSKRAYDVMTELNNIGLKISIDDFGTGFSSLSYLKQLPTQSLKIDRTFVSNMLDDENDAVIVRSTIDLAHNMGRTVIAEGVENKDTLDILEILGCDFVQGFYLCMPMPVEDVTAWFLANKNKRPT